MKKILYFIAAACVVMAAACSSDVDDFNVNDYIVSDDAGVLRVGVTMPEDGTRVNTASLQGMVWERGDVLHVRAYDDAMTPLGDDTVIRLVSGENTSRAVFEGSATAGAAFYDFTYAGRNHRYEGGVLTTDYNSQVQDGFGTKNIKDVLLLRAAAVPADKVADVHMMLMNSVLRVNVKNVPQFLRDARQTAVQWEMNEGTGVVNASLTLNGRMGSGDNFLYMAFDTGATNSSMNATVLTFTSAGFYVRAAGTPAGDVSYADGKIYTMTVSDVSTDKARALVWGEVMPDETLAPEGCIKVKFTDGYEAPAMFGSGKLKWLSGPDDEGYHVYKTAADEIPDNVFYDNLMIESVRCSPQIKRIGEGAFQGCENLRSVVMPYGGMMSSLMLSCFDGCRSLDVIDIPEGVTAVYEYAFTGTAVRDIVFPSTVSVVQRGVLEGTALRSLTIKTDMADVVDFSAMGLLFGNGGVAPKGCVLFLDSSWMNSDMVDGSRFYGISFAAIVFI